MATRFRKGDFLPCFKPLLFNAKFPHKPSARIGVCFTGDLFGPWVNDDVLLATHARISEHPEHTFVLLTKNSERLSLVRWPSNAWVGTSITGAETPERQEAMLAALERVEGAGVKWLSYEPMLGRLAVIPPLWLDWLVVGAQTGPGAKPPERGWVFQAEWDASCPTWRKNNLTRYFDIPERQELPK